MSIQWYARYPGDYMRDTAHLTLIQHGAYTRLLDHYYATSRPLQADMVALYRLSAAMTEEERAAVESVADEFFPVNGDGQRHNKRADIEIQRRTDQHSALSRAGSLGVAAREAKRKPGMMPGIKAGLCKTTPTTTSTSIPTVTSEEVSVQGKPEQTERRPKRTPKLADDAEWLAGIRAEYAKIGVDVDRQAVMAKAWLSGPKGKGRSFTRQYFLNWLSRCDRNLDGGLPASGTTYAGGPGSTFKSRFK